ncbi:hypothetical protein [Ruminococcus flavefaciens]|nr:hypothetical protein [Ruminococcus flavefaciens]
MLNGRFHYITLGTEMEDETRKNKAILTFFGVFHKKELPDNGSS